MKSSSLMMALVALATTPELGGLPPRGKPERSPTRRAEKLAAAQAKRARRAARRAAKVATACHAQQHSDQMDCAACGLSWDVNDPAPPSCKQAA